MPGSLPTSKADPQERLEVTVLLRHRAASDFRAAADKLHRREPAPERMGRHRFADTFGSDPQDAALVSAFARQYGLAVVHHAVARRTMILSGTVEQFSAAFGVDLQTFQFADGTYRGRVGSVHLPSDLQGVVQAVLGLDNRPQARSHLRIRPSDAPASASYTPVEVAALYGFSGGGGVGETIGIIELGGGFAPSDLRSYFATLGVTAPRVSAVSVDHAKNLATGSASGPDGEVMLDIEIAGAIAPGAKIVVYFAPNTDAGFIDAVTTAIHDEKNAPSVISISWGSPESAWTQQAQTAFDQALQAAAMLGVTVCVASGDNGSTDGANDGHEHVDFPASSSYALACGGTAIAASGGTITSEVVWNDAGGGASGGGESAIFDLPAWQSGLQLTLASGVARPLEKRGVPDVAGDAAPGSGYVVRVDGADAVFGGTSAVAPLWAALIARANAVAGRALGFVNPTLYANRTAFRDVISGDNDAYTATLGWDACTGLGTPAPEVFQIPAAPEPVVANAERRTLLARR
jgi:kumamolisin